MANLHNPSPMRVTDGEPRRWLQGRFPADSFARNQNPDTGIIFKRPSGAGDGDSDDQLYCVANDRGWFCADSQTNALNGVAGGQYTELPDGAVVVSRRSNETP